mgnify:CR=1 FL=1
MNKQPEALCLADAIDYSDVAFGIEAAKELRRLHEVNQELLKSLKEVQDCASYWSEYDVPLGIVDRINAAINKGKTT